jgi:hypothetical protein
VMCYFMSEFQISFFCSCKNYKKTCRSWKVTQTINEMH